MNPAQFFSIAYLDLYRAKYSFKIPVLMVPYNGSKGVPALPKEDQDVDRGLTKGLPTTCTAALKSNLD